MQLAEVAHAVFGYGDGEFYKHMDYDMDHLPVGPDLTEEEEALIPED